MSTSKNSNLITLQLVTFAITCSTLLLAGLVFFDVITPDAGYNKENDSFKMIFLAVGIVNIAMGFILPEFLMKHASKNQDNINSSQPLNIQMYFTNTILSFAMFEACAILGFVSYYSAGDKTFSLINIGLALIAMSIKWPNNSRF